MGLEENRELPSGREKGLPIPTEVFLPIRALAKLEEKGVLGLGSGRNADTVLLAGAPTVPLPAQVLTGRIVRFATWVRDQLPAPATRRSPPSSRRRHRHRPARARRHPLPARLHPAAARLTHSRRPASRQ
ncbi:hypothetical protein ACN469_24195 [Corallococcus terminator]